MSAAAVAAAIVARSHGLVKFVTVRCLAFGVHPGVKLADVDRFSLPAYLDNLQERTHLRLKDGAAHGQVCGRLADPD